MIRTATAPAAKRRWRAAVLAEAGVDVAPLRTLDAVDATLAALVAVIVAEGSPWFRLGDPTRAACSSPATARRGRTPRA
jgi:hypothetical protein